MSDLFTKEELAELARYTGPVVHLGSNIAMGAWFGIISFPEEDLTIPAGGDRVQPSKRIGHGRGKTRRYGEFVYVED